MLALRVGAIQLCMGVFKLGVIVNFISRPVIIGCINAAAIIIGLSQLHKLPGIPWGAAIPFCGTSGRCRARSAAPAFPPWPSACSRWPL